MSVKFNPSISRQSATTSTRAARGKAKETSTPKTTSPKDGLTDDMRAMLEHLRAPQGEHSLGVSQDGKVTVREEQPNAALTQKEEAPKTTESKPKLKTPRAGSDMAQMIEDITNPAGVTTLSINNKGLIVMGTVDSDGKVTLKSKPEAPTEKTESRSWGSFRNKEQFAFNSGTVPPGMVAAAGLLSVNMIMPGTAMLAATVGAALPSALMGGMLLGVSLARNIGSQANSAIGQSGDQRNHIGTRNNTGRGSDLIRQWGGVGLDSQTLPAKTKRDEPTTKKPRAGSPMEEMLQNMANPKPETAVMVGGDGLVGMHSNPFG